MTTSGFSTRDAVRNGTPSAPTALHVGEYRGRAEAWNAFVAAQPGATHYHQLQWTDVLRKTFRHRSLPLAATDDSGRIHGVLPLVRISSPLFGRFLVSMPFVSYGGPLGSAAAVVALADAASAEGRRMRATLVELRSAVEQPLNAWHVSHRKLTVMLDLAPDDAAQFARLDSKLRSQIRRPQKDGVVVRIGTELVDDFFAVFGPHMRDLGSPALPKRFFAELVQAFPDSVLVAVAYHEGLPIASGFGFRYADEFEITWASALVSHKKLAANMLVYWELMRHCIALGVSRFNFGRCSPDSGTHRFKRQWGGADTPLYWYQPPESAGASTPSSDSSGFALAQRLWTRLPVPVANLIGAQLVKYIP